MINNFALIISSCDKFSDLWKQHFIQLEKYWHGEWPRVYLVTDKETDFHWNGVEVLFFDDDMPKRIKHACECINERFVLITLDDYFVINDVYESNLQILTDFMELNNADYLSIYHRRYAKKRYYTEINNIKPIDLNQKYAVHLYPAIWNKEFFIKCASENESPWVFEAKLTQKAIDNQAKCFFNNSGVFVILDVVRKGCVLHKADNYFKKHHIDIGNRKKVSWKVEIKQSIADFIWWYMPRWVYVIARRIGTIFGMKFFSEE